VLLLVGNVIPLIMVLIPLSVGVAMLRCGFFDIDVVINRAEVYSPLTAMLTFTFIYLGGVVSMQYAFRMLTGQESQLAVVVSTLVIPALFNPLRRRMQSFVMSRSAVRVRSSAPWRCQHRSAI
jgi:hypothetical protein